MHLDTFFNILNEDNVVCLDWRTVPNRTPEDLFRPVEVYERNEEEVGFKNEETS